jgi:hypothetical protein
MFRLVVNRGLQAEILLALRRVNRSACAASRIRDYFGCGGGGRLGDCELINQSFFKFTGITVPKRKRKTYENLRF